MTRLEHMLCPAVTGLSRVLDLGDLTAGEGRDYTPSDTALTQERVLGRVQLCLDLEVALVVSVTLLLVSVVLAMNRPSTNARVPFAMKEVNMCVRGVGGTYPREGGNGCATGCSVVRRGVPGMHVRPCLSLHRWAR
jgi:hypothetical protein